MQIETLDEYKVRIKSIPTKNLLKMRYYGFCYGSMEECRLMYAKERALYAELETREHIGTPKVQRQLRAKQKRNGGRKRLQK